MIVERLTKEREDDWNYFNPLCNFPCFSLGIFNSIQVWLRELGLI